MVKTLGSRRKKIKEETWHSLHFSFWHFNTYGNFIELAVISKSPLSINSNISMKLGLLAKAKELRYASQEEARVSRKLPFSHIEWFNTLSMPGAWFWFPLTFAQVTHFALYSYSSFKTLWNYYFLMCVGEMFLHAARKN